MCDSYWRCVSRETCTARAVTTRVTSLNDSVTLISSPAQHTHRPCTDRINRRQAVENMRRRLDDDPLVPVRATYDNENARRRRDDEPLIPPFASVETMLKRHRSAKLPPLPRTRADVAITGEWATTVDGRRFHVPTDDADMVVFATDADFRTLAEATTIYLDGTFKSCPSLYAQLYTVHALVHGQVVPLVYSLLGSKLRSTYYDFFAVLRRYISNLGLVFDPAFIVTDFEHSAIHALRQHFPQARRIGCFFHFCSALWRKVQDVGLSTLYRTDEEFRLHIQSHMALAFLPVSCVPNMLIRLHAQYADNADVVQFHRYFNNTWNDGLFQLTLWNQYGVEHQMRTNNFVESWHARFNRVVRGAHPNIFALVNYMKREESTVSTTLEHMRRGQPPPHRRAKYDVIDRRIKEIHDEHVRGCIDADELLRRVRHVMHVFH
jgi:MULE transposase domain